MPKMKSKSAAKKRFKFTASGKVKFSRAGVRHLLTGGSRKQKRNLKGTAVMKKCDQGHVENCLPYGR